MHRSYFLKGLKMLKLHACTFLASTAKIPTTRSIVFGSTGCTQARLQSVPGWCPTFFPVVSRRLEREEHGEQSDGHKRD